MKKLKYYWFCLRWLWRHRGWSDTRQKYKAMNREWREMRMTICRNCEYCKQEGRQQAQSFTLGRKRYYCNHAAVKSMKDKRGLPLYPFVGFGDMTPYSPLVLKTSPRWCPLRQNGRKAIQEVST